ncbi:putative Tic20 family protein [Winogradskyella pacifica]|uniref:Putative Tic20 family protein n=1 Tax=Winogradskyella pacifica TaxID=664642 RepID=A0A3D9MWQ8_9FLAO|nr:helix-turn-helix domain-containing protein [Winogradskyella pacifica]REE24431.1 putative Tic20 family protein [Winogradskyella pacifica]
MNEIGEKIKEARKMKGLSQEELADLAKINLRTIQRIETNQNEPRGKTLNLICKVLEINTEDILDYGKQIDKTYLTYFHLSVLSFLVIPIGNIILPLILWLTKKDKIIGLKNSGANVLNFQIIWTFVTSIIIIGYALTKIMHYEKFSFLGYIFIGLYLLNIILPIIAVIKIRKNNFQKSYPKLIQIIK